MHHALLISEIAQEICAALDQSSLPAVARTCRALCDPALDELWRDLYSIYPFLHLLNQTSTEQNQECLSSHQWTTLCAYSARTRSLYMCVIDDFPCLGRFPSLSDPPDPDAFFPSLRTVAWYPENHLTMIPFLRLLCGPALSSLSAEFATDPTSLAMLASLGIICPNIVDISISAANATFSVDLADALSTSICRWNHLRHVSCDDLTASAMEHLSQAKRLESLTAYASDRLSSFSQPVCTHDLPFAHLQHLHLYAGLLSTTTACLKGLRLALHEFRLDLFDTEEAFTALSSLRDLFLTLVETCSHACLTRLYLCIIYPHFPSSDALATLRDAKPLFTFTNLRTVSLDGFSAFSLDDDDMTQLAAAWPHLETLTLATYVNHPVASLPTCRSLVCLARACPRLRTLALVIDTTAALDACDVRSDVLDELCLGNSPIRAPAAVARILHLLYPALKHVDLSVWNKEPLNRLPRRDRYEVGWGTVNLELQQLRQAGTG